MNKFITRVVAAGLLSLGLHSVLVQGCALAVPVIVYVHGQQDDAAPAASASDSNSSDYGNSDNAGGAGNADSQGDYNPFDPRNPNSIYNPSSCPRGVYC